MVLCRIAVSAKIGDNRKSENLQNVLVCITVFTHSGSETTEIDRKCTDVNCKNFKHREMMTIPHFRSVEPHLYLVHFSEVLLPQFGSMSLKKQNGKIHEPDSFSDLLKPMTGG